MSRAAKEGELFREFSSIFTAIDYLRSHPLGAIYHPGLPDDAFVMVAGQDVLYYAAERSHMNREVVEILTDREINDLFFSYPARGWYYRDRTSFGELIGGVAFFDELRDLGQAMIAA